MWLVAGLQVLVAGKISQAVVVAAAAYRDLETFRQRTGITNTKLIKDLKHVDTQVSRGCWVWTALEPRPAVPNMPLTPQPQSIGGSHSVIMPKLR